MRIQRTFNAEAGFTLVEMLVAMAVLLVGIVAAFGVFASSKNASLVAQRHEVAVHQAQREMERLRAFTYTELGLTSLPSHSTDPNNPNYRVQPGDQFRSKTNPAPCGGGGQPPCNVDEDLVSAGLIEPGPTHFYVGETGAAVTGDVYRYITWRDENCVTCIGSHNTKRLSVAVTIDAVAGRPGIGPKKPIWLSSIVIDPNDGPPGGGGGSGTTGPTTSAQSFYFYDKTCSNTDSNNTYTAPGGPSATNDTASPGTSCDNATASKRPDLMGPAVPTYSPTDPPLNFSNDLPNASPFEWPGGLLLPHANAASTCANTAYALDTPTGGGDTDLSTPGKWQVHAWSTRKFTADFTLSGSAFLSIWTTSAGSGAGAGRFCATLVEDAAADTTIGSMSRTYNPWPTTKNEPGRSCGASDFPCGRQLTFQFNLTGTQISSGSRLILVISVLGTSDKDIVLLYDDPRYRSLFQVATTTPCNSTGVPCSSS
jgi:prepilin-type N-terminal cleavage/methylation domain-containing protein